MKTLVEKRKTVWARILECGDFVRGSITSVCSKCSRANCLCDTKSPSKAYRLTYKDARQKTRIVYVAKSRLPDIRKRVANHAQLRKLLDQLMTLNIAIFKKGAERRPNSCG
jgi:hypothetical protein